MCGAFAEPIAGHMVQVYKDASLAAHEDPREREHEGAHGHVRPARGKDGLRGERSDKGGETRGAMVMLYSSRGNICHGCRGVGRRGGDGYSTFPG